MSLRDWYMLTKPGIVYGNALHFTAAYLIGFTWANNLLTFVFSLVGTSLVIASACVANNYIDRGIDARMKRTQGRALASNKLPGYEAILFAVILGLAGASILAAAKLWLVLELAAIAFVSYVWVYTYAKRYTVHSTLIGTIPGALPAVAGYVTNAGYSTAGAWAIFLLVVAWQMPHFYAISLYRKKEYEAAKLPVISTLLPSRTVILYMTLWAMVYVVAILLLIAANVFSLVIGSIMLVGSLFWVYTISQGLSRRYSDDWAKGIFKQSLLLSLLLLACGCAQAIMA